MRNGKMKNEKEFNTKGKEIENVIYRYDRKGTITSLSTLFEKIKYKYTKFDTIKKVVRKSPLYFREIILKYGKNNRKVERIDYLNDSLVLQHTYK